MTILHRLREVALAAGLDVRRATEMPQAGLASLLTHRGVDCVIDIGANRGQYAGELRRFGYTGAISSFEPLPHAYALLAQRAEADPAWTVYNHALGDQDGMINLNVAGNEGGASSSVLPMLPRHEAAAPDAGYVDVIQVPIRRLDSIWGEVVAPGAASLIKMDVQGFERAVLEGARDSVRTAVGLQLEVSLAPLYEGALNLPQVLEIADELGMAIVHVEPGFSDPRNQELLQLDAVFMRRDGA